MHKEQRLRDRNIKVDFIHKIITKTKENKTNRKKQNKRKQ